MRNGARPGRSGWQLRLLASLVCASACGPRVEPGTAIVVSVKTDLVIGTELRELSYRVFQVDADADVDPAVGEYTAAAQTLEHPFVILHQRADALLLSVEGFDATAQEPVVVARVRARFEAGRTLALHVFLARACLYTVCEASGLSCYGGSYGEVAAGECAAVPGPFPLSIIDAPGEESNWAPMSAPAVSLDAPPIFGRQADASRFTTSADASR